MKLFLKERKREAGDAMSFIFQPEEPISWQAGQFMHYILPHEHTDNRGTERWFTISSPPFAGLPMLTTRFAGEQSSSFKKALFSLPMGASIEANTPDGDFIIEEPGRDFVFIAGGAGITPYHAMLSDMDHKGVSIKGSLLYANQNADFIFKDELDASAMKHPSFAISYFVSPQRIDAAAIKKERAGLDSPLYYVSGPEPMVESLEKILGTMGVREIDLKRDFFSGYIWSN